MAEEVGSDEEMNFQEEIGPGEEIERVSYSLRHLTLDVKNQKDEGTCLAIAVADMASTTLSKFHNETILLSPQSMIDEGIVLPRDAIKHLMKADGGLQRIGTIPHRRLRDYQSGYQQDELYRLNNIRFFDNRRSIKYHLANNFSENGFRFPALGGLRMHRFADPKVARRAAGEGMFYTDDRLIFDNSDLEQVERYDRMYGITHALLITGINTMSDNPNDHYVEVKNSHGWKWGRGGFSNLSIDLLDYVIIPAHDHPDRLPIVNYVE